MKRSTTKMRAFTALLHANSALVSLVFVMVLMISLVIFGAIPLRNNQDELGPVPDDAPYKQSALSDDERTEDLLSRMTLKEKIGQMALVEKNSIHEVTDISSFGLGAILSGAGAKPEENTAEGWKDMTSGFLDLSTDSRLAIPVLYGVDAIHGHANVPGAVVFPHLIGLGAAGDAELVEKVAAVTAQELAATGISWSFSPTLDLPQDIRWGRTYETFGDDSKLAELLGPAYVRGLQKTGGGYSASSTDIFVLSTLKHYIGVGGMKWDSSSNKSFRIDQGMTPEDQTLLRRTYLPPFAAGVKAGAKSVMVGLNSWGDTKLSVHEYLITSVLKDELNFEGFVVSDWYGVYEMPGSDYRAAIKAINAGVDMVMLPFDYKAFVKNVNIAVRVGEIKEERIDDAVRRILKVKFALGLFDQESNAAYTTDLIGSSEHRAVAKEAVAASLVLLKNENVLPITDDIKHIRVAGSAADNVGRQSGAWTVEWQGIDGNWLQGATSILQGIKARAGEETHVEYMIDGNFSTTSGESADLGIAIVGEAPYAEGWGDSEMPILSFEDLQTIERLKASSDKILVIIISGRPLLITEDIDSWEGLVAAWLPGSEGGGVADVLFGDVPFKGKLPLPWPAYLQQIPIAPDGTTADRTLPLFPRGFGL